MTGHLRTCPYRNSFTDPEQCSVCAGERKGRDAEASAPLAPATYTHSPVAQQALGEMRATIADARRRYREESRS
jgi:hypothetical protein